MRGLTYDYANECIGLRGERFEYEINMLVNAVQRQIDIHEISISTIYEPNRSTHFNPFKDSYQIYKILFAEFFKFAFSGITSSILDLGAFAALFHLFKDQLGQDTIILVATFGARVISSLYNYFVNRHLVFKSTSRNTLIKYYILCILQAFLSWFFVDQLFKLFDLATPTFVKILVDLILFLLSFQIQQRFIFKKDNR